MTYPQSLYQNQCYYAAAIAFPPASQHPGLETAFLAYPSLSRIMDNGGGIDEQYLDKIFEPYFTTKDVNGTGIGLYISKEIIHKHMKGTLHATNSTDGAKFTISIPKHKAE